jgi:hypothetical protein
MRKKVLILLVFIIAIGLMTPLATAAVKPGAKCSKQGQISTTAGKKYTCVKSGSKLIWNKGVPVKAAVKSELNPVLKPVVPTPTSTPTPIPTIERKDWELTYLKIWDEFEKSQNQGSFPFDYKLGPTVNQDKARESIAAYDKAMKPWLAILDGAKVSPIIWTIMSEKDYGWWKQVVDQQEGASANYAWNPDTKMLGHCQLSSKVFCGYGSTYKSNTPDYKFLQYNVIGSNYSQTPNGNTVNHESVHFYQLSVVQGFPRDLPCWYVEGQASLYGNSLEYNLTTQRTSSIRQRDNFKGIVRQYQPSADTFASSDWVEVLENMYQPHVSCSSQQDYFKYAVGMFAWEFLYDKFGPKVMHQVLLDFKEGKSFDAASQARLGSTLQQLNEKLAAHFVQIFARGN